MTTITVQNLKCGGCANTIKNAVQNIKGTKDVNVNKETSEVSFIADDEHIISKVKTKLSHLGYPEVDDKNTMMHKAVSYISCATGRMQNDN